jgi:hypothetical protein
MGGGTQIHQPTPPSQPSTADAIKTWVKSMPQVYQTQMEYSPLLAQQQVDLAQQFAGPMGQAVYEAQAAMYPETAQLQESLAGQAGEGMEAGLSPTEKEMYRDTFAANLGTNIGSGIGADYMSRGMLGAQQQRQDYYRNLGLSVAGRQPLAAPGTPSTPDYMSGFSPQSNMDFMASTYGPYVAGSQPMMYQNQSPLGGILGGVGAGMQGIGAAGGLGDFFSAKRFKENITLWN